MNNQSKRPLLATVVALAWPAMLEQALQTCVQYADSALVGRLGVQATAAVPALPVKPVSQARQL